MLKNRIGQFQEGHTIVYGLKIAHRCADTTVIDSVACRFCLTFGREGQTREGKSKDTGSNTEWRRNSANTVKYFGAPFRTDCYSSHLKTCHAAKWAEYSKCTTDQKRIFFDCKNEPFVNTIHSHFESVTPKKVFHFDDSIIEDLIGTMLFDNTDDDEVNSKERALEMFTKTVLSERIRFLTIFW